MKNQLNQKNSKSKGSKNRKNQQAVLKNERKCGKTNRKAEDKDKDNDPLPVAWKKEPVEARPSDDGLLAQYKEVAKKVSTMQDRNKSAGPCLEKLELLEGKVFAALRRGVEVAHFDTLGCLFEFQLNMRMMSADIFVLVNPSTDNAASIVEEALALGFTCRRME